MRILPRHGLILILIPLQLACSDHAPVQPLIYWTTHALTKVHPNDPPGQSQSVELWAASNEFEPFQIVFRTGWDRLEGLDLTLGDLVGPRGAKIDGRYGAIYLEHYLNLQRPSSVEGGTGEWPDPLVPRIDRYSGERRQGFPFNLVGGRNQPVWVEIYVPPATPPGLYEGHVAISVQGKSEGSILIRLTVWPFELPSTSSLPTSFGFSGVSALKQHRGRYTSDEDLYQITHLYAKAALWHRISIYGGSLTPPPFAVNGDRVQIDWGHYDQEVGPFLDGTVFSSRDPLPGARATSIDLRAHAALDTDLKKVLYWKEWVRHFREKGWFERLFYYVWDEPHENLLPQVAQRARLARRADPELRNLLTAPLHSPLAGLIDIWCPVMNCFDSKPGVPYCILSPVPREAYQREIVQGRSVWWYHACSSHGCDIVGGDYFTGWPSYVIDAPSLAHRITEWVTWKYAIQGELYYMLNEAFPRLIDPWEDVYVHGGNGDGTLFYPGRPDRIGGSTHIPIESIRLKLIREGLEDYEYFVLLSQLGASDFAHEQVARIVQKTYQWDPHPENLYQVRRELGQRLKEISEGTP